MIHLRRVLDINVIVMLIKCVHFFPPIYNFFHVHFGIDLSLRNKLSVNVQFNCSSVAHLVWIKFKISCQYPITTLVSGGILY